MNIFSYCLYFIAMAWFCSCFPSVHARVVDDNTAVFQERGPTTFLAGEQNQISAFSALPYGFALQNAVTTCTYKSYFPVSGELSLNGGTLFLGADLGLANPLHVFTTGSIYGNQRAVEFPQSLRTLQIPLSEAARSMNSVTQVYSSAIVKSVDWSQDDRYVALGLYKNGYSPKLEVLHFDDVSLTVTAYLMMNEPIHKVCWHPSKKIIAIGKDGEKGSESLQLFSFDEATRSLKKMEGVEAGFRQVQALSWHPSGKWLAVGRKFPGAEVALYSFNDAHEPVLSEVASMRLAQHRPIGNNALSWDATGKYLAVGVDRLPHEPQLLLYEFTENDFVLRASAFVEVGINALDWSPQGPYLAVGLAGGRDIPRLKLFRFDYEKKTLHEEVSVQTFENKSIFSLHWSKSGRYLALGRMQGNNEGEIQLFEVSEDHKKISLLHFDTTQRNVYSVRWSSKGDYLLAGDSLQRSSLYRLNDAFFFDNVRLSFHSDVECMVPFVFQGACRVTNPGSSLYFPKKMPLTINEKSSVVFEGTHVFFAHDPLLLFQGTPDSYGCLTFKNSFISSPGHMMATPGTITFDGNSNVIGGYIAAVTCAEKATLNLSGKTSIGGRLSLKDQVSVSGNGHLLDMSLGGTLVVDQGAEVDVSNTVIKGLGGTKGAILLSDSYATLNLSNVTLVLDDDITFTCGTVRLNGPCTFVVKDHSITFTGNSVCHIDGVCLTVDRGGASAAGGLLFASPESRYCSLTNTATIRYPNGDKAAHLISDDKEGLTSLIVQNSNAIVALADAVRVYGDILATATTDLLLTGSFAGIHDALSANNELLVSISNSVVSLAQRVMADEELIRATSCAISAVDSTIHLHEKMLASIDTGPGDIVFSGNQKLSHDIFISYDHSIRFTANSVLDGNSHCVNLSNKAKNIITLDPGVSVTFSHLTLHNFTENAFNISPGAQATFGEGVTLDFGGDVEVQRPWTFEGECFIEGNEHTIQLREQGSIAHYGVGTLAWRNACITGLKNSNMRAYDEKSAFRFEESLLRFDDIFTWEQGALLFNKDVRLTGNGELWYQSEATSTINKHSCLMLDPGFTFSYAPPSGNKNCLYFADESSKMLLDAARLSVSSCGMQLLKGRMIVNNYSSVFCDPCSTATGLVIGDGIREHDFTVEILPASSFEVASGQLLYLNTE